MATFTAEADADTLAAATVVIEWGDGEASGAVVGTYLDQPTLHPVFGTHTYTEPGSYQTAVTVYYRGVAVGAGFGMVEVAAFQGTDDRFSVIHDRTLTIDAAEGLFRNDGPVASELTLTSFTQPESGAVAVGSDGALTFTPAAGFVGTASFQYTASYHGVSVTRQVTVEVTNSAPVAENAEYDGAFAEGLSYYATNAEHPLGLIAANAADFDGDTLTVTQLGEAQYGEVVLNADGTFTYTPGADFTTGDEFVYTVSDGVSSATGVVRLRASADALLAGQNVLLAQPPAAKFGIPEPVEPRLRGWTTVQHLWQEEQKNLVRAGINTLRDGVNRVLQSDDDARVWIDANNRVQGMVRIASGDDATKPHGYVRYDGQQFSGEVYFPVKDEKGAVIRVEKVTVSESGGIDGKIPYSQNSFAVFKRGKFDSLQIKTDNGLTISAGNDGTYSVLNENGRGITLVQKPGGVKLSIDQNNSITLLKNGFGVDFKDLLKIDVTGNANAAPTVSSAVSLGKVGSISLGYTPNAGLSASANLTLKNGTFGFTYTPLNTGGARVEIKAEYKWVGAIAPKLPVTEGFANVSVGVDNANKKVNYSLKFEIGVKW